MRYNRREAVRHLRGSCPEMDRFLADCGPLKLKVAKADLFEALAAAIVYQQLSGKAAVTIHNRFCGLFDDDRPEAGKAGEIPMEALRSAGLSNNKALAILDLAEKCVDGTLGSYRGLARLDDEAVVRKLCQVRGIGPWTAQMYLIFNLGRPDVMPATDLGVQKGVQYVYRTPELPSPDEVLDLTAHLSPYRSAAAWYFWLAADTGLVSQ